MTDLADGAGGRRTKAFGYDDLNRLTSATAANLWGTESYSYDPLNNIRARIGNGATFTYNYDATNKLVSISGAGSSSFGYDNRGNVTSRNGSTLQFDQKNQLAQIDGLATYSYDAAGRRVMKQPAGGSPTYYFYTQAGQLLFQMEEGVTATNFIYLGRKLIASNDTSLLQPPPAPSIDAPSSSTTGAYTVSWDGAPANTYTLQQQVNGGSWVSLQTSTAHSLDVSGRGNGTYGYHVRACNTAGCSPWSGTANVTVLLPPKAPTSITVPSTSTGSHVVSWNASATASSYTLQHRLGAGSWATVYTGSATGRTVTEGATGSYTYRVHACNVSGCSAYATSSAVSVTIKPASAPSLTVPSSSTGSYTVSWGAVTGATSYTLQEQANGGSWANAYSGSGRSKAFSKGNGTFGYRVQACNAGGCGPWSASDSIVVAHIPATPAAPSASYTGTTYKPTVTVRWSSETYATRYELQQTDPQNGTDTVYTGTATSWTQFVIADGQVTYRVRACSNAGCSSYSAYSVGLMLSSGAGGFGGEPALQAVPETAPATDATTLGGDPASSGSTAAPTDEGADHA